MKLRQYRENDCKEIANLFYQTVHAVNAKDYSKEQLGVWATGKIDLERWNCSFLEHYTVVAVIDDGIVGFGDIDKEGYLDRLYVHKDYQNQGIATALYQELRTQVKAQKIVTHASITARPFFEKMGFHLVKEQQVERGGIFLTNYVMEVLMMQ